MRKQDHLVQLISSLSTAEKRNFKQFSSTQPGNKRYLALFDALEKEPNYQAAALMKKLDLNSKQLRNDKYYLSQSLLKCLRNYEQPDVNVPVNRLVEISRNEITILIGRGLHDYALEMANKTLDLAMEYEMFDMAGNLMAVKHICLINLERFDELDDAFFDERERLARVTAEYRALHRLSSSLWQAERKRAFKTPELEKIMEHAIMKQRPEKLQSLVAQETWFDITLNYHTINNNHIEALNIARMQWKLYDKHRSIRQIAPFIWAKGYMYLIDKESESGNARTALRLLHKFGQILDSPKPMLSKGTTRWFKEHNYVLNTIALFKLNRYKEVITEAGSPYSPSARRPIYEQFLMLFCHGIALFHEKECDAAIIKLNELLQLNATEREDLQPYIRPVIILCQLHLGNYQVVPYLIKSSRSWMKRQKKGSPEMDLFFSIAYGIAKAPALQRPQHWAKMQQALTAGKLPNLHAHLHLDQWLQCNVKL